VCVHAFALFATQTINSAVAGPPCLSLLQVYLAGAAAPAANLALLDDMLACRHQLAQLLGFPSYAAFKAADSTLAGR
jgi:hypothetical protein